MMIECHWRRFTRASVLAAFMLTVVGCSGSGDNLPREAVYGVVTLDGQPLADGTIQFSPQAVGENPTSGGALIKDGNFSIAQEVGLVPGTYWVSIYAPAKGGDQGKSAQPGGRGNKATDVAKETIPAKYNSPTTLKYEVKKGGNDKLKFDLKTTD